MASSIYTEAPPGVNKYSEIQDWQAITRSSAALRAYINKPHASNPVSIRNILQVTALRKLTVDQHHHYEETEFFPAIEKAAGHKDLMDGAVDQHAAFHDGLERFKSYLQEKGPSFLSEELIQIMDSFSEPLYNHLKEEPQIIADLSQYNTPETPIDILAIAAEAGKKQLNIFFLFNVFLIFFLNMESIEFENVLWQTSFPPVNKPIKRLMTKGAPMWQNRLWRFESCTPDDMVVEEAGLGC
ncbi:hypothetical protein ACHAO1_008630 [Botrytis cinerea]